MHIYYLRIVLEGELHCANTHSAEVASVLGNVSTVRKTAVEGRVEHVETLPHTVLFDERIKNTNPLVDLATDGLVLVEDL